MLHVLYWRFKGDRGQGLAEYALILGLIAVVSIAALTFLGTTISDVLSTIGATL
jgi:Flp pilus assembly pilin Flp